MHEDPLSWWYPGFGEVQVIDRLPSDVRGLLADAVAEDPAFLNEYLLPTLGSIDPVGQIVSDFEYVLTDIELEESGLSGLGDLDGLRKKLKKAVKKVKAVAKKVHAPAKAIIRKVAEPVKKISKDVGQSVKRIAKSSVGQAIAAPFTMGMSVRGVREGIKAGMASKYAAPIIGVIGAVAAPLTGGASVAAAAALLAANQTYQAKKAAQAARRMAKAEASQLEAQAQQLETETSAQLDQFYSQNQAWFEAHGVSQAQWNGMTFEQKTATIDAAAKGQLQLVQQPVQQPVQQQEQFQQPIYQQEPSGGGTYAPSSGGGGFAPTSGGGGGGGGFIPQEVGAPKIAKAGLFDGPLPIIMAAGALVYILFGQKGHGRSRKTRRNPVRRSSRWIAAA